MFYTDKLKDIILTAFDTETSGGYPVYSDICEFAAVKWRGGKILETYQTLLKPRELMTDFIIGIHGISNEMVKDAPVISDKIQEIHKFLSDGFLVAHHAPFDLGFISYEFEKAALNLPIRPVFCTSLLSRALFPEPLNHKLQTLIEFFNIPKGTAHRALDDAKACLEVALRCIEKKGWDESVQSLLAVQGKEIIWNNFSLNQLRESEMGRNLIAAMEKKSEVMIVYGTDAKAENFRPIRPKGIVRSPNGDFIFAFCEIDKIDKRFYMRRIQRVKLVDQTELF